MPLMYRSLVPILLWSIAIFLIGMHGGRHSLAGTFWLALLPAFFCCVSALTVRLIPGIRPAILIVSGVLCVFGGMLSSWVGFAAIMAGGFGMLVTLRSMNDQSEPIPFRAIRVLLIAWIAAELLVEVTRLALGPANVVTSLPSGSPGLEFIGHWIATSPRLVRQLELLLTFSLFAGLSTPGIGAEFLRLCGKHFLVVVCCLGFVAVTFASQALSQWGGISLVELPVTPSASFFAQQNRLPGPFIDPNSAGIVLASGIVAFLATKRWTAAAVAVSLLLLTGTRSGLLLVGVFLIARFIFGAPHGEPASNGAQNARAVFKRALCVAGALGVSVLAANVVPASWLGQLPIGLARTVESIRLDSSADALFSRTALWHVAVAQFKDAPLLGVGLDRYRELLAPYAQALNLPLGVWSDNPGNWFLFVAVELGMIGILFLLVDLFRLRVRGTDKRQSAMPVLFSVLASLAFGCHLHDPASSVFLGLLVSSALVSSRESAVSSWLRAPFRRTSAASIPPHLALLAFPGILLCSFTFPRGLYGWELASAGVLTRWTSNDSIIAVPCRGGTPTIELSAIPGKIRTNMKIVISAFPRFLGGQPEAQVEINAAGPSSLSLDALVCHEFPNSPFLQKLGIDPGYRLVRIRVAPPWIPAQNGIGADTRILGAQLRYTEPWPLADL